MSAMDPDTPQPNSTAGEPGAAEPKAAGTRSSVQERLQGKPMLIYGTLVGGALVLFLLLMVVWLSTRDDSSKVKLCLDTNVADTETAILDGSIRRVDVLIDNEQPMQGPTAIQFQLEGGECRKLPEGADNRAQLLQVLGLVELYNQQGDGNIRVEYQRETVPPNLLVTSTVMPTQAPPTMAPSPVSGTPLPVLVSSPTALPTRTASPTATATPSPTRTPTRPATRIPTTVPTKPALTPTP